MGETHFLSLSGAIEFINGPLIWISAFIFSAGLLFQTIRLVLLKKRTSAPVIKLSRAYFDDTPDDMIPKTPGYRIMKLKLTLAGRKPGVFFSTLAFHVCLFTAPLFLFAHNILFQEFAGFRLPALHERVTDVMTFIVMGGVLFFLFRRLFVSGVRAVTTPGDFLLLFLTGAPYLTGILAYHQVFDYKTLITLHILAGEILLIVIPFTRFVHMVFFFVFRFFAQGEYSMGYK